MNPDTGKIEMLPLDQTDPRMVAIEESDMTPKQKREMQVSLHDHRSKLGKKLTGIRSKVAYPLQENYGCQTHHKGIPCRQMMAFAIPAGKDKQGVPRIVTAGLVPRPPSRKIQIPINHRGQPRLEKDPPKKVKPQRIGNATLHQLSCMGGEMHKLQMKMRRASGIFTCRHQRGKKISFPVPGPTPPDKTQSRPQADK